MDQAAPKPRSPWLYVLLGCGGFALLLCLGSGAVMGFGYLKAKDQLAGLVDRTKATEKATTMLGAIPEGYVASQSMSMFGLMEMAMLIKGTEAADGGFENIEREFVFLSLIANDSTKDTKAYFMSPPGQPEPEGAGMMRAKDMIKRGRFTIDAVTMYYVVSRGDLDVGPQAQRRSSDFKRVNTAILFDCPGDRLHLGVWSMPDPDPTLDSKSLPLSGTVGDEAQLVPFLKQLTPCGA
jgi:hypothetical protein